MKVFRTGDDTIDQKSVRDGGPNGTLLDVKLSATTAEGLQRKVNMLIESLIEEEK